MATDQELLQGLWRQVSDISRGRPTHASWSHYLFKGNQVKAIETSKVDGGDFDLFAIDATVFPKTMTIKRGLRPDGSFAMVHRLLYQLDGDTLKLCWPSVYGDFPDSFSDQEHSVETLARDKGALPKTKLPSGKEPMEDSYLGKLKWQDNYDWWEARISIQENTEINVTISPDGLADDSAIAKASAFVKWAQENQPATKEYCARELLECYNRSWNDADPINADKFMAAIKLEAISVSGEGFATLWYNDGNLFAGHTIELLVEKNGVFRAADIAG